ncbi:Spermatogenesis-associated protein 31A6 [Manis javanica]|nr:Spermatogenesis-associated protein 31A6 [Manis javanica]
MRAAIIGHVKKPLNKPQYLIWTEIRHPEWPTLQKQLESQRALSSGVKRPQEVCSVPTSTHPEDSRVAALLPENLPTSPEIWKKLEQHIQERFIRHRRELPGNIQETLQLKRLQGELPGTSQAQRKHGPSWTVTFPGESNTDVQKAGLWLRQDLGTGLRGFMGRVPEDLSSGSESPLMMLQGLVSPVFFSHVSRIPDESGDHWSCQETPDKPQSLIPTEVHHPQWPTLQKQLESQRALSSGVKRPQEVFSVPTSTHPEDSRVAAMLPEKWPNSPEIRKKLEQHLQERFIRHQWELPGKIQETVELKRLQEDLSSGSRSSLMMLQGLVSPVFFSHVSRIPDESGDHWSCQETPGENKPQYLIWTEIRHPEWPTLQKQLESQRALSSGVKRPQEVCSVLTSTHPEDSRVAALLPENLPTSPEIWKKLEQHIQERFIRHRRELPGNIQETLQLKRLQGELPGTSQAQRKHGPSWTVTFPGENNTDVQKAGLWLRQDLGTGLRGFMGRVPEDLSSGSESPLMMLQGLVSPVFFSHVSRIPDESGDHWSCQETPGEPYSNTEAVSELKPKVKMEKKKQEKMRRDQLNDQYLELLEKQRLHFKTVKEFKECIARQRPSSHRSVMWEPYHRAQTVRSCSATGSPETQLTCGTCADLCASLCGADTADRSLCS